MTVLLALAGVVAAVLIDEAMTFGGRRYHRRHGGVRRREWQAVCGKPAVIDGGADLADRLATPAKGACDNRVS